MNYKLVFKSIFYIFLFLFKLTLLSQTKVNSIHEITKDFNSFWKYWNENIFLSKRFVPLNSKGNEIPKDTFIKHLIENNYIPIKLQSAKLKYKLYKLNINSTNNHDIIMTTRNLARYELKYSNLKGDNFVNYNFVDIYDRKFNVNNCFGKVILINTWFIECPPCVKEIPDLNELYNKYASRKDVVFLALSTNMENKLKSFLKKVPFYFSIIPDQEYFIRTRFRLNLFPSFILINKQGVIIKASGKLEDIIDDFIMALNN